MAKVKVKKWNELYDVVGIVPGIIIHKGKPIDLGKTDIPVLIIQKLASEGCKFIRLKSVSVIPNEIIL